MCQESGRLALTHCWSRDKWRNTIPWWWKHLGIWKRRHICILPTLVITGSLFIVGTSFSFLFYTVHQPFLFIPNIGPFMFRPRDTVKGYSTSGYEAFSGKRMVMLQCCSQTHRLWDGFSKYYAFLAYKTLISVF